MTGGRPALATLLADKEQLGLEHRTVLGVMRVHAEVNSLLERVSWLRDTLVALNEAILMLSWREANALAGKQADASTRLTVFAALLAVPALVFAIYGTNFSHLPWILGERWGYPIVLGVLIIVNAILPHQDVEVFGDAAHSGQGVAG